MIWGKRRKITQKEMFSMCLLFVQLPGMPADTSVKVFRSCGVQTDPWVPGHTSQETMSKKDADNLKPTLIPLSMYGERSSEFRCVSSWKWGDWWEANSFTKLL